MKNKRSAMLSVAVILGALASPGRAQDNLSIYGVLQTAYEQFHTSGADGSSAVANVGGNVSRIPIYGSFFGLRGRESLGGGLSTIFQLESYVFLNGEQPPGFNPLNSRNTRVGLQDDKWGTVFFGIWDTPMRFLLIHAPFPGTTFDGGQWLANGIGNTVANGQAPGSFERRATNTVAYWSPHIRGFQARVHYTLNDGSAGGNGAHLLSMSGAYARGPLTLMAAYETHHGYGGPGTSDRAVALYADLKVGQADFGTILTDLRYQRQIGGRSADLSVRGGQIFGTYRIGQGVIKAAYTHMTNGSGSLSGLSTNTSGQVAVNPAGYVGQVTSGSGTGANVYEIGYDYYLSKRTNLFANLMYLKNDRHGSYTPFGGVPVSSGALGVSDTVLALGMVTRF